MTLGFGEAEQIAARKIIAKCYQAILQAGGERMVARAILRRAALQRVSADYLRAATYFSDLDREEAPERYTSFRPAYYDLSDTAYAVTFTFQHTQRKHPLATDGWALLVTHGVLLVDQPGGALSFVDGRKIDLTYEEMKS